jgi:hypothetical protein
VTDEAQLPVIAPTGNVVLSTEPSGSLVARGLAAIETRQTELRSRNTESDAEKLVDDAYDALKHGAIAEAVNLVRTAAKRKHVRAHKLLGTIYSAVADVIGDQINRDPLAYAWYACSIMSLQEINGSLNLFPPVRSTEFDEIFQSSGLYELRSEVDFTNYRNWRQWLSKFMAPEHISQARILYRDRKSDFIARYVEAAEDGHAESQFRLGRAYDWGQGVPKDRKLAFEWWHKAAMQGCAAAQWDLMLKYNYERADPVKALAWYTIYWESGFTVGPGKKRYETEGIIWGYPAVWEHGGGVPLTEAEISKAKLFAQEWIEKHAP